MTYARRLTAATAASAVALGALAGCATTPTYQDPDVARPQPNALAAPPLADAINAAGYDIFAAVAGKNEGDVVLSPLSIGVAFGMVDAGASGDVSAALEELFGFPGEGEQRWEGFNALTQGVETEPNPPRAELSPEEWYPQAPIVRIANRMFHDDQFEAEPAYPQTLAKWWGAGIEPLAMRTDNEGARKRINEWVAERTEGLIPELVPQGSINSETVLMLVNAIYMLADWETPFDPNLTRDEDFHLLDGSTREVPMMYHDHYNTDAEVGDDYVAVRLPYANSDLSMLVIVPDEGAYAAVEARLDAGFVAEVDAALDETLLTLLMPSFISESKVNLRQVIEGDLGIERLFGVEDLEGIGPRLEVASAVHGAKIKVDERGTEAAAATAIGVEATGMPLPPELNVRADRPFLYLVRDESTGAVLFVGRVMDPQQ